MADPTPAPEPAKRVKRYLIPRNASRLSLLSAAAASALLLVGVGAYFSGWTEGASPGPVSSAHAGLSSNCAECHQARTGVVDLRCERCHDPLDSHRFGSAAHVLTGSDDPWKAAHAPAMQCSACHLEHRGRTAVVAAVRDEACATCHAFGGFNRHPEFAIVRSEAPSSNGLEFSHAGHLKTLAATGEDRCERCHQPTGDQQGFQPISFDKFCASCHLKNGVLTINGTDPAETSPFAAELLQPLGQPHATVEPPDGRGRQKLTNLPHADPWLLDRVARLTAAIDPAGAMASDARTRVAQAIRATESVARGAVAGLSTADLTQWADALKSDLTVIDRQLAAPAGQLSADSKTQLTDLASAVAAADPSLAGSVSALAPPTTPAPTATADELHRQFDARRAELTALLDAIRQRGDAGAVKTATDLQQRLAALTAGATPAASPTDQAALLDRLQALGHAIDVIRAQAGASAGADLDRALDLARQQIAPGTTSAGMASRQAELTQLLDTLERGADPVLRRRIAELRSALDELAAGATGDAALENRRAEKARLLDRIALELELPADSPGPTPSVVREQTAVINNHAAALGRQLAALNQPASTLPPLNVSADDARKGVKALLYACMTCHRLDPEGTSLLPVRADLHQLTAASFSHQPHLAQTKCETCHAGVADSPSGDDALMPKVATCQSCHKSSQARANCAECHRYHAQPLTALGLSTRARR
jgi:hypothetical protein